LKSLYKDEEIENGKRKCVQNTNLNLSLTSATSKSSERSPEKEVRVESKEEESFEEDQQLRTNNEEDFEEDIVAQLGINNEEDFEQDIDAQLEINNEEDFEEDIDTQLGINNETKKDEQSEPKQQLNTNNNLDGSDLFVDIASNRDVHLGESIKIGNYLLNGIVHPFPHGICIKNIYFYVSFGNQSIQFGDLCSDGFIFVGATEISPKVFLSFSKLNDDDNYVCIDIEEFISENSFIKATNKQLSDNGTKTKDDFIVDATLKIVNGYSSLYQMHHKDSPV
jgi:hypothetical protein